MPLNNRNLSNKSIICQLLFDDYTIQKNTLTKKTIDILKEKYPSVYEQLDETGFNERRIFSWEYLDYLRGVPFGHVVLGKKQTKDTESECKLYLERNYGSGRHRRYHHVDISSSMPDEDILDMYNTLIPEEKDIVDMTNALIRKKN